MCALDIEWIKWRQCLSLGGNCKMTQWYLLYHQYNVSPLLFPSSLPWKNSSLAFNTPRFPAIPNKDLLPKEHPHLTVCKAIYTRMWMTGWWFISSPFRILCILKVSTFSLLILHHFSTPEQEHLQKIKVAWEGDAPDFTRWISFVSQGNSVVVWGNRSK